ncbi:MAG: hypothetical protein AVDCRST_MAG88-3961, partial [uncultured Thermomicrobiales bacterium]
AGCHGDLVYRLDHRARWGHALRGDHDPGNRDPQRDPRLRPGASRRAGGGGLAG